MMAVVFIAGGGAAILGLVIGSRWLDAVSWRQSLVAMTVQFPRDLKASEVSAWLGLLGSLRVPIALELVATHEHIAHYLLVPKNRRTDLLAGTRTVLPGLRLEDAPSYLTNMSVEWQAAAGAGQRVRNLAWLDRHPGRPGDLAVPRPAVHPAQGRPHHTRPPGRTRPNLGAGRDR